MFDDFGDFSKLQILVNNANKELNLTRNYTYTIGKDCMTDGIRISKPLTINGNGFTIDAKNQSRIFYIEKYVENVTINNLRLINGFMNDDGGTILVFNSYNAEIRNCIFENNTATGTGGAIRYTMSTGTVINSTFLNNKASINDLTIDKTNETLTFTLTGKENYINAIYCSWSDVNFTNVTYWNGQKVTENNPPMTGYATGQDIILEIYDGSNKIVKNITLQTNSQGQAIYNYAKFEDGNYTFKAYHPDDRYYTYIEQKGTFTLDRTHTYPSEVKVNIENKTEFRYGECNISFEITNRTEVRVLITDADYAHIFYDEDTLLNYVELNLPAKDDYYRIIVTNYGNETYDGSSDTKLFKITKINSTTSIDPISDNITYGDTVEVKFNSDDALYNITVFDENKKVAYNTTTDKKTVQISNLNAGNYTILIVNCGTENKTSSNASATLK